MILRPPYFEVNDLAWVLSSPGLLNESYFNDRVVQDRVLSRNGQLLQTALASLEADPRPVLEFLSSRGTGGRLGRYFEFLLQYCLTQLHRVETLQSNIQVRSTSKRTLGEFDLVFRTLATRAAEHWEASVKFYICTARDPEEAKHKQFFMGTLVHDRLDRKLRKFFDAQLRLSETPEGRETLNRLGFNTVHPRALLKGYFYYPAETDWRKHPSPIEIAPHHERGWWLTADRLQALPHSPASFYIVLPLSRWLSRFNGWITPDFVLSHAELTARIRRLFDSSYARRVNYEMMVAEVEIIDERENLIHVTEISRGNILHPAWPAHARSSLMAENRV